MQSSSGRMARSNREKTQSIPLDIRRRQPRFTSEKFRRTSQVQLMVSTILREAWHASPFASLRGPSATSKSAAGLALAISAKTRAVCSGRLKRKIATGVFKSMNPPYVRYRLKSGQSVSERTHPARGHGPIIILEKDRGRDDRSIHRYSNV